MFLHLSVILFTGEICHTPLPWADTPWGRHPPGADTPLGRPLSRHLPGQTPPPGRHPLGRHPPGQTHPPDRHPPAQCMLGYGQQADGTHPTGMQSCSTN